MEDTVKNTLLKNMYVRKDILSDHLLDNVDGQILHGFSYQRTYPIHCLPAPRLLAVTGIVYVLLHYVRRPCHKLERAVPKMVKLTVTFHEGNAV